MLYHIKYAHEFVVICCLLVMITFFGEVMWFTCAKSPMLFHWHYGYCMIVRTNSKSCCLFVTNKNKWKLICKFNVFIQGFASELIFCNVANHDDVTKALPEQMLTKMCATIWHHWAKVSQLYHIHQQMEYWQLLTSFGCFCLRALF